MIRVVLGALAEATAEAIVRPIRSDLDPVSAASRDVAAAAGSAPEERLARLGMLPVGGAAVTPAGSLDAMYIIHASVMSEDQPQTNHTVQRALRNVLRRAADWGMASLALPPIGIGVGLTEPEVSARLLVDILYDHLDEGRDPLDLTIVTASSFEMERFTRLVDAAAAERAG